VIDPAPGGVIIHVHVIPRSGRAGICGIRDGSVLVRLNAPPVEGAANAELIEILAETLGVSKKTLTIVSGEHNRRKCVRAAGVSADDALRLLNGL